MAHGRASGIGDRRALAPRLRLDGAFLRMHVAVDHLQIGCAPEAQELRPRCVALLAPDLEERRLVVDLGAAPEPSAATGAAALLHALQELHLVARRVPEAPGDDAGRM